MNKIESISKRQKMEAMEKKPILAASRVYREWGAALRRLEQLDKAKVAYDEAYKYDPQDVHLLVGRSLVYSDAVKPQQAFEDATRAMEIDPMLMDAKSMQARAMYTMSEFERSIVINYQGSRLRKQPHYFEEGINQGMETEQDCIGKNAGNVLIDNLPLIKKQALYFGKPEVPKKEHQSRIPTAQKVKRLSQREIRRRQLLHRVLAMKYLGPMANDKFFIQELMNDKTIHSANKAGTEKLIMVMDEGYKSLCKRQEILQHQRPYYTIKHTEMSISKRLNKHNKEMLQREQRINTKLSESFIGKLIKCKAEARINDLINTATRFQIFLDCKSIRTFPDINGVTDRLYKIISEALLSMYRLSYRLNEQENSRRIAFLMGMPVERAKCHDTVIANYPQHYGHSKDNVIKLKTALKDSENSYRTCYLYHELSRTVAFQKNFPLSRYYAKKCQLLAAKIGSSSWWLNGLLAILSGNIQQGNVHDVQLQIEAAFEWCKTNDMSEDLKAFLAKCLEVVTDISFNLTDEEAIVKRERDILKILDGDTRIQTEVLFKRISTMPVGRRFYVMPGCYNYMKDPVARQKYRQQRISIVPGREKGLRRAPQSGVKGMQCFNY